MAPSKQASGSAVSGKSPKPLGTDSAADPFSHLTPGPLGLKDQADLSRVRDERLEKLLKQYNDMIADARRKGKQVAADNLQHWLDGSGDDRRLSMSWLRGFSEVTGAEAENRKRFEEKTIGPFALGLMDEFSGVKQDFWDSKLTGSVFEELYYASGTSTLTSRGKFALARHGDWVHVAGMVEHHWWDPYDWHANLGAYVPGHGSISDADALELEAAGYGKAFGMFCFWHETISGKYGIDTGLLNSPGAPFNPAARAAGWASIISLWNPPANGPPITTPSPTATATRCRGWSNATGGSEVRGARKSAGRDRLSRLRLGLKALQTRSGAANHL